MNNTPPWCDEEGRANIPFCITQISSYLSRLGCHCTTIVQATTSGRGLGVVTHPEEHFNAHCSNCASSEWNNGHHVCAAGYQRIAARISSATETNFVNLMRGPRARTRRYYVSLRESQCCILRGVAPTAPAHGNHSSSDSAR